MGISRLFRSEEASASAKMNILRGTAEFSLDESDQWTAAINGQSFLEGDALRTGVNTEISLNALEGTNLFVNAQGEVSFTKLQEQKNTKQLVLEIPRGQIWGNVMEKEFEAEESLFEIHTPQGVISTEGGTFDLEISENEVVVRVLTGIITVSVQEGAKVETVDIGARRKLVLNTSTREVVLSGQGDGILDGLEEDFEESEWNLVHFEKFFPQEAAQIRRRIEMRAPSNLTTPLDLEITEDLESPIISSPSDGHHIPANGDTVTLEGTAPTEAFQIAINGYTLTKFQPGDRKWSYFASQKFGTLVPGENLYSVVAITRDGKKSRAAEIKVFFDVKPSAPVAETVTEVTEEPSAEIASGDFSAPVVLKPVRENPETPFVTNDPVLTISGTVDSNTNAVEVNGFRLKQFQPGEKMFRYTANANYGNFLVGENVFEIVAFGPNDQRSKTSLKVVYNPS
jgi:hypothetical protein